MRGLLKLLVCSAGSIPGTTPLPGMDPTWTRACRLNGYQTQLAIWTLLQQRPSTPAAAQGLCSSKPLASAPSTGSSMTLRDNQLLLSPRLRSQVPDHYRLHRHLEDRRETAPIRCDFRLHCAPPGWHQRFVTASRSVFCYLINVRQRRPSNIGSSTPNCRYN